MTREDELKILKHLEEDQELKKKVMKYKKKGNSLEVAYNLALTDYPEYDKFEAW